MWILVPLAFRPPSTFVDFDTRRRIWGVEAPYRGLIQRAALIYVEFLTFARRPENMWNRAGKMLEGRLIPMVHSVF